MTTLDVTPFEEQAAATLKRASPQVVDAITRIMSPSANVSWRGLPDNSTERVAPLDDEHIISFTNGRALPFSAGISHAYTFVNSTNNPVWNVLSTPGFLFLPKENSRWSLALMNEPTLLSHGWFRLEYVGKLLPSDPNDQPIVVTGPLPTSNPQLVDLYTMGMSLYGQNGAGGPSCAVNFWMAVKDGARARKFAAKMRIGASSFTCLSNVDTFNDGGSVKQAVWGCEHRYRGEAGILVQPAPGTAPYYASSPYYQWDGLQADAAYTGGTTKPNFIISTLQEAMSQSHEYTNAANKDPLNGGAYPIWRTNGDFVDADYVLIDNPFGVQFVCNTSESSVKMGNSCFSFQPTRAPVTITTFDNLHSSNSLDITCRQLSEIVPGLGSPLNPFAIMTPCVEGFDEMYKAAALITGRCNPASANDMGTLWRKVRGYFDKYRHVISGLATRIPEVGVPLASIIESAPYQQSAKDRKIDMSRRKEKTDANIANLTTQMSKAGISVKRKAPVKPKAKVSFKTKKRTAMPKRR